ncbi:MAG: hypothetical protein HYV15_03555 [Elusimicrobia bacterium]|nr:hypothetical protein [Elusimicrobiota bacterium]
MRLVLAGATALAAAGLLAAFLGLAKTFSSWRWTALAPAPLAPARVPAVPVADEPMVTAMTAADVDSVPARLEPRPRRFEPSEPEPEVPLGSLAPKAGKAPARKAVRPKTRFKALKALSDANPRLLMQDGAGFDGGGTQSEAYFEGAAPEPAREPGAQSSSGASSAARPAPKRRLRSVTSGTSARPAPVPASTPNPSYAPESEAGPDPEPQPEEE